MLWAPAAATAGGSTLEDATNDTKQVLRTLWAASGDPSVTLDEECSPTKACRNMQGVTFDAYTEEGTDPAAAWREQLAREGKLDPSAPTVGDLVLGRRDGR